MSILLVKNSSTIPIPSYEQVDPRSTDNNHQNIEGLFDDKCY